MDEGFCVLGTLQHPSYTTFFIHKVLSTQHHTYGRSCSQTECVDMEISKKRLCADKQQTLLFSLPACARCRRAPLHHLYCSGERLFVGPQTSHLCLNIFLTCPSKHIGRVRARRSSTYNDQNTGTQSQFDRSKYKTQDQRKLGPKFDDYSPHVPQKSDLEKLPLEYRSFSYTHSHTRTQLKALPRIQVFLFCCLQVWYFGCKRENSVLSKTSV